MEAVVAEITAGNRNVEWIVSSALRQLESDAKVAEGRAKAEAEGLRVLDHEGHRPSGYVEVGTYGGLDLDAKAHATEPCHAVVVCAATARPSRCAPTASATPARGPARSRRRPRPDPTPTPGPRRRPAARRPSTAGSSSTSLLAGRVAKAEVVRLVLPNYLDDANANEQAAMAKLLGLEAADGDRYHRWGEALRAYAAASEASLLRACLAFSLVQGEDAIAGGWANERGARHRAFLGAKGYQPTAYEVEQAEATARRHEQSSARSADCGADDATADMAANPGAVEPGLDNGGQSDLDDGDAGQDHGDAGPHGDAGQDDDGDPAGDEDAFDGAG